MANRQLKFQLMLKDRKDFSNDTVGGIDVKAILDDEVAIANSRSPSDFDRLRMKLEITGEELVNLRIDKIPTLVDPVIPKVGLVALAGGSDTGKSCLARQLAIDISIGSTEFLGWKINTTFRSAIYVSTEDPMDATSFILRAVSRSWSLEPKSLESLRVIFNPRDLINNLCDSLADRPADLIVIDAFADLYGKKMNESNQVRSFLQEYADLAQRHGCAILFIHHTAKRTDYEPPSKHHVLGSQGFESKMRLVAELRVDNHDKDMRHLCIVKGNYLPFDFKRESFALRFHPDFTFTNTGERVHFDLLAKRNPTDVDRKEKYDQAQKLKLEGKTYKQIADALGYKSKSSVSKLFEDFGSEGAFVCSTYLGERNERTESSVVENTNEPPF